MLKKNTGELNYKYVIKKSVKAPVIKGDILGEIIVSDKEKELASIPLKADKTVRIVTFSKIFRILVNNI